MGFVGKDLFFDETMSLFAYLWGIRLFTLFALAAWIGVVMALDPDEAGSVGTVLFFISLFVLLIGVLTLGVTGMYRRALGDTGAAHHLGSAFRQAFLLACLGIGIVYFRYAGVLAWWSAAFLFAAVLLLELSLRRLFVSKHTEKHISR